MEQNLTRCYNDVTDSVDFTCHSTSTACRVMLIASWFWYYLLSHINWWTHVQCYVRNAAVHRNASHMQCKRTSYAVERCCISPHGMISTCSCCAAILGDHNSLDYNPLSTSSSSALVSAVHHVCNLQEMCTAHKNAEMHCLIGNALCLPCKILLTSFAVVNVNKQYRG